MKKIKWLFFDLGHTLVNEDVSQRKRIENAVLYLNSVSVSVTYEQFYHEVQNASRNFKSPFITAFSKFSHDDVSYRILRNLKCSMTTQYLCCRHSKTNMIWRL